MDAITKALGLMLLAMIGIVAVTLIIMTVIKIWFGFYWILILAAFGFTGWVTFMICLDYVREKNEDRDQDA